MNYADLVQRIRASESTVEAETLLHDYVRNFTYTVGVDIGDNHDQCNVVVGCKHFVGGPLLIVFAEDLTVTKGKLQVVPTEWVGLTPEERDNFWKADQMTSKEWEELFDAIEAKLKEKNHVTSN